MIGLVFQKIQFHLDRDIIPRHLTNFLLGSRPATEGHVLAKQRVLTLEMTIMVPILILSLDLFGGFPLRLMQPSTLGSDCAILDGRGG